MRLYKVSATRSDGAVSTLWETSKEGCGSARADLTSRGHRRDDIVTTAIDFTPTKVGFVEMLNEHAQ